jgi:hypothetical protein
MADTAVDQGLGNTPSDGVTSRGINPAGVGDKAVHLPPYHTEETYRIAQEREKDAKDKKYEFKANGYTVTERDAKKGEVPNPIDPTVVAQLGDQYKPKMWDVTAENFLMTFNTANAAENYALTHAEAHKDLPATVSKA